MDNIIKIGNSKFWTDSGILYCQFRNNSTNYKFGTESVALFIHAIDKLCKGKPMPFLIDTRDSQGTFTRESANLLANSPTLVKLRMSEAYVFNTIGIKLVVASYKRIYEPSTPFSVFNNLESAKAYCVETINNFYGSN
ncbi:hypothetical protein FG167_02975 [Lacinutrix sp. WUR7]|uniref:DUF7793 family protein n=1 Tax=Lacinutrix sp. WUR7 TaxID=2653681 RepID=UPI00193D99CE|nr:hypothetical protein [Lacinutrix sp. WUR7]QRM88228.1 hypothetical protein FG167_02975 [Lacinutrix sp. WUR7]